MSGAQRRGDEIGMLPRHLKQLRGLVFEAFRAGRSMLVDGSVASDHLVEFQGWLTRDVFAGEEPIVLREGTTAGCRNCGHKQSEHGDGGVDRSDASCDHLDCHCLRYYPAVDIRLPANDELCCLRCSARLDPHSVAVYCSNQCAYDDA
jgi:hypothetical protein